MTIFTTTVNDEQMSNKVRVVRTNQLLCCCFVTASIEVTSLTLELVTFEKGDHESESDMEIQTVFLGLDWMESLRGNKRPGTTCYTSIYIIIYTFFLIGLTVCRLLACDLFGISSEASLGMTLKHDSS